MTTLDELLPIIQLAIGPVILISGIGLLLLSFTNRYGRTIDRARIINVGLKTAGKAHNEIHDTEQIKVLWKRAKLLRKSIICASISVLFASLLVIAIFLSFILNLSLASVLIGLFIVCLLFLIAAISLFIIDVNVSLAALKVELKIP